MLHKALKAKLLNSEHRTTRVKTSREATLRAKISRIKKHSRTEKRAPHTRKTLHKTTSGAQKILKKFRDNPIVKPREENEWESWQTFNPGAIFLNGKVHFLYRAIGKDGMSRLGYASSRNGFIINERPPRPAYEHSTQKKPSFNVYSILSGGSWGGCEDPRLTRVDDEDVLYMTYTAATGGLGVALTSIKINDFLNKRWNWKHPALISPPWQVHKNWVIFPEKINGKYAILHSINPEILITYVDSLDFDESKNYIESYYSGEFKKRGSWDGLVRGVGPPPIKTDYGWLVLYHGMANGDWSKYKVGAMLLDLNDPTKIICRSKKPVLEPSEYYEYNGFKGGVVYASGAVVKDGNLIIYYGGADSYVCAAHAPLEKFISELIPSGNPKLEKSARLKTARS